MATGYQKSMFSSTDQKAMTPDDVMVKIQRWFAHGQRMYDPCPAEWDPETMRDGLVGDWGACNYVNPPYNDLARWMAKCVEQSNKGKRVICLIPQRGDVNWWHDYVLAHADEIHFIRQGIRFKASNGKGARANGTYKRKCPFAICIVVYTGKSAGKSGCPSIHSIDFYEEEKAELARQKAEAKARKKKRKRLVQTASTKLVETQ